MPMRLGAGGDRTDTTDRTSASTSVAGMRRVDWIRITVGDGPTAAEAIGVGHRHPAARPLPLPLAARLTAEGVPFVVHHQGPGAQPTGNGAG